MTHSSSSVRSSSSKKNVTISCDYLMQLEEDLGNYRLVAGIEANLYKKCNHQGSLHCVDFSPQSGWIYAAANGVLIPITMKCV